MLSAFFQSIVLSGATVHTLVPGEAPRRLEVLIQGDRITALEPAGRTESFPADARRVDLTGMHLVPGLVDALVSHDPEHDRLYVASGVTSVFDQGGNMTTALAEREAAARERGPGPALFTAGAPLAGPSARMGIVVASPEEAAEKLGRLFADYRLDWVTMTPDLSTAAWKRALEVVHAKGLTVFGPLLASSSLGEALDAKQDGLHHIDALLPAGKAWGEVDLDLLAPRIEKLAASGTALVPTLALHVSRAVVPRTDAPELQHLAPLYVQQWGLDAALRQRAFDDPEKGEPRKRGAVAAIELQKSVLRAAHEKRVRLVAGSASPRPWLFPGRALVEELVLWASAGVPAPDVLRAATQVAAEAFGVKDRGTLAAGKVADLVAYGADPEADITVLREPKLVVLRGRVLDRGMLDGLVGDLRTKQMELQERSMGPEPIAVGDAPVPPGPTGSTGSSGPADPAGVVVARGSLEHRFAGLRLSAENWSVTRLADGALVYGTRLRTPGGIAMADTELVLSQTIQDERLMAFDLEVKTGTRTVVTKGTFAGNTLNVEQRVDGMFVSNHPVRDRVLLVDVGSVLAPLQVAHHAVAGEFKVLFFDDFEPAVGPWELRIDDKGTLLLRTQAGYMTATFGADGLAETVKREQGRGVSDYASLKREAPAGPWPIRPENRIPSQVGAPR